MAKLFLLRHAQSQWNLENRFSGWIDVPLSKKGIEDVKKISKRLGKVKIDAVYTSPLIRNSETALELLRLSKRKYPIFRHFDGKMEKWANFKELNKSYIPVYVSENLNERYYGSLQGCDKKETIKKYGAKKVQLWRRGFDNDPPGGGEGLDEVFKRAVPFFKKHIEGDLKKGKNVLVVSSHNALRAIIKYIDNVPKKDVMGIEMEPGTMIRYDFDKSLKFKNKKAL